MQGEIQKTDLSTFRHIKARLDVIKFIRKCIDEDNCNKETMIKALEIIEGDSEKR